MTKRLRTWWFTPALAALGLVIAAYLTWVHYEEDILVCGVGDCSLVQTSDYATIGSVPVAVLGIIGFASLLVLSLIRHLRTTWSDVASIGILFIGFTSLLYFAYLTYVEIWVLEAICQWCVLSSIVMLTIFVLELARYLRDDSA
jgi:uncharacterized membrane protein